MTTRNSTDNRSRNRRFDLALSLARQTLYQFLAVALSDPQQGAWDILADRESQRIVRSAATLVRRYKSAVADPLAPGERRLGELNPAAVLARLPRAADVFNGQYERAFGLLSVGPCAACETEYISSKFTFQRSQNMADVGGFYAAFGLTVSPDRPERHDHIVLELEFMACLLGLERQAAELGTATGEERADICRLAQSHFLREHLAWWAPAFARLLAHENPDGFFAAAGDLLTALIPAERALLGVEPASQFARPSTVERPEECETCSLAP